jgi:hypothetical protein
MAARAPQPDPATRRRGPTGGVVAIVVLVVMCLGWWLFSGNGPAGPDGNAQRLASPQVTVSGDPSATPALPDVPGTVRIDGYVPEAGNRVALNYTSGPARCVGRLDTPTVLENDAAVTVTLTLVPPTSPPRRCRDATELHTVRIDLDAPLEGRSLLDGSRAQPTRVEQDATENE